MTTPDANQPGLADETRDNMMRRTIDELTADLGGQGKYEELGWAIIRLIQENPRA